MPDGYYRHPTLHDDTVVFVCEDDLWTVPAAGGIARRLTAGLGAASSPLLSPDGAQIAFVGREAGESDIYVMPAVGGTPRRVTFMGSTAIHMAAWTPDNRIVFASNGGQPFFRVLRLFTAAPDGGEPELINIGPANAISYGPDGGAVIGRSGVDPARWKRYRGGRAGQIWIDLTGANEYIPLVDPGGNLANPLWVGKRIYFISDHEGAGNLYSCSLGGEDVRRHTDHESFYARNPTTDGRRIVYHAGADLYLFNPDSDRSRVIPIEFHSPQTQRSRKFVSAARYLHDWNLHPQGHSLAIISRGKPFTFSNWEGAVTQHGDVNGSRYRLLRWLHDGKRLIAVTDADGEECFTILHANGDAAAVLLPELDTGRVVDLLPSPTDDQLVFSNHRYEFMHLDLTSHELRLIDRGKNGHMRGFDWSPDGNWVAYSINTGLRSATIKLWHLPSGETHVVTEPILADVQPAFDPRGDYLYFLSYREFNPVYDALHFDLNFPRGMRPYLVTLRNDQPSPFILQPQADEDGGEDDTADGENEPETPDEPEVEPEDGAAGDEAAAEVTKETPLQIDLDGISQRVLAFPVAEGRFGYIRGTADGRVLYSRYPVEGALGKPPPWLQTEPASDAVLHVYDFSAQEEDTLVSDIAAFDVTANGKTLIYRAGNNLRVLKAGDKPNNRASHGASRKTGWISLRRVRVSVSPADEWRQMFREAWRLQRDNFWTADMSSVDWRAVHDSYLPLVNRISSRSEFSDLMWEMQGELGTSHAYEYGGDYRAEPNYAQGYLGADFEYDREARSWRVAAIVHGDSWDPERDSPLNGPGINIRVGDRILAINGRTLTADTPPASQLVNMAATEVTLTVQSDEDSEPRTVAVKTLRAETAARYRDWVRRNRRAVHAATDGRVGYIHIPDMGAQGYAEFHRGFLQAVDREGLIVDVRFNRGGHVSDLLLEKLARRRLGYDVTRWGELPEPYPKESLMGPIVALTNEYAASDGDIFSHSFKLLGLGPLVGARTWGGVIGISPSHTLVDGTVTTQPEYSFWFEDVGWRVENYGTEPTIAVDNTPADYARGVDAQLDRAIEEIKSLLATNPPALPDFDNRPNLARPKLPPRTT